MDHRGHAAHFLTRVDRLNSQHAELALGLYRDHELVRALLRRASLPEGTERVALSLDDRAEGPYIIVNREGKFVTCLGKGMHVYDTPIVKRARLDQVAGRLGALREVLARADAGGTKERDRHMKQVLAGRNNLSREEFDELVSWAPLLYPYYLTQAFEGARVNDVTLRRLQITKRIGRRDEPVLRDYCETAWAQLHLFSLLAATPELLVEHYAETEWRGSKEYRTWFSHQLMGLLTWAGFIRGAVFGVWLQALVVPAIEEELENIKTFQHALNGMMTLYAVYRSDTQGNARLLEVLRALRARGEESTLMHACAGYAEAVLINSETREDDTVTRLGDEVAEKLLLTRYGPEATEHLAAMPESDRLALLLAEPRTIKVGGEMATVACCLTEASTLKPRDFYVSAAHRIPVPWRKEDGLLWLAPRLHSDLRRKSEPVRRAATPGRNDPCSCGSGKKYKRCCGFN